MNIEHAVGLLKEAEQQARGIDPFSTRLRPLDAANAWRIARARDARRRAAGFQQTGYKLGWTSDAMRQAFGISAPNYGSLWDYMAVGEVLALDDLIHPKAEPEFAFRAETVLHGPHVTEQDVVRAGSWAVAIEVVDPRWKSYDFTWADNVADGSSAARYCTGPWGSPSSPAPAWSLQMSAGTTAHAGQGEAVLGSPLSAVVFLVHALHETGHRLLPGMVVLTGGVTPPVDLSDGLRIKVESPELGACELMCREGSTLT